jgi:hypothetical protein
VNAVIEINVIGQSVDPDPVNRLIGAIAGAYRLQVIRAIKQHGMAVHTGFRRGDTRSRGTLYPSMAIPAIDTVITRVMLVAELNGLITHDVLVRQVRRARSQQDTRQRQTRQEKRREDTETGDEIRAAVKNLRHDYICTLEVSAPGGSGNLGVHQNLSGMCKPESKIDALSFQQNILECNCCTLFFRHIFTRSRELNDRIGSNILNFRGDSQAFV